MSRKQIARHETRSIFLRDSFARELLNNRLGLEVTDSIFASLPCYTRGPNKGQVKGVLNWESVEVGGWSNIFGVLKPGTRALRIANTMWSSYSDSVKLHHFDKKDDNYLLNDKDRKEFLPGVLRRIQEILSK